MGELQEINTVPRLTHHFVKNGVFLKNPIMLIDVGARKGFESHWRHLGDQVHQIGFEPSPDSFAECVSSKSVGNGTYFPFALDKISGRRTLFVTSYLSASSFLRPNNRMVERLGLQNLLKIEKEVEVDTIDLDSFCIANEIKYVDFMKIDAEGAELDILLGAEQTLAQHVLGVSIEIGFAEYRDGQPHFGEIDDVLRKLGFDLFDIDLNWSTRIRDEERFSQPRSRGRLTVGQALYLKDAVKAMEAIDRTGSVFSTDKVLKLVTLFELFGLRDCAAELVQKATREGYINSQDSDLYCRLLYPWQFRVSERLLNNPVVSLFREKNNISTFFRRCLKKFDLP